MPPPSIDKTKGLPERPRLAYSSSDGASSGGGHLIHRQTSSHQHVDRRPTRRRSAPPSYK
jgi:hypothetical protein